jgi:hypothetical protein
VSLRQQMSDERDEVLREAKRLGGLLWLPWGKISRKERLAELADAYERLTEQLARLDRVDAFMRAFETPSGTATQ